MNKHFILVRYIAATNYRPSRISLTSGRSRKDAVDRVIIPYDYLNSSDLSTIASAWLKDVGYTIHCTCETPKGVGILVNEFGRLRDASAGKKIERDLKGTKLDFPL